MKTELLSATQDAEKLMIAIARESSERENKGEDIDKLIKYLVKHKHWSPFEHAHISVRITTSRAMAAQFLRHRSFSFQELSQRYAVVGEQEPLELRKQCENNRQSSSEVMDTGIQDWGSAAIRTAEAYYNFLLKKGVARESARMVLPMNTQTRLIMTGSIRSWIHFFEVRCDEHAQKEAREIAESIKETIFKRVCPKTYDALYGLVSPSSGTSNTLQPSSMCHARDVEEFNKAVGEYFKAKESSEVEKAATSDPIKVGDLITIHDNNGGAGNPFSEGDVGTVTDIGPDFYTVDFTGQGNPCVKGYGSHLTFKWRCTKLDPNEFQ